jgi:hypothetical protein
MGRWTQYDEVGTISLPNTSVLANDAYKDDYRLPEGMKRVGYDSDTGRYYFRDSNGVLYEGGEGAEYSEMTRGELPFIATLCLSELFIYFIWQYPAHLLQQLKRARMKIWKLHHLGQMGTKHSQQKT